MILPERLGPQDLARLAEFCRAHQTAVLAIIFVDTVGSTRITAQSGEGAGLHLRSCLERTISDALRSNPAVMLVKLIGDGAILVSTEPSTAVEAALNIADGARSQTESPSSKDTLGLRIGLHLGQVTLDERLQPDILGLHVHKAARVQAACLPGRVLMTYPIFDSAYPRLQRRADLSWSYAGEFELKGFPAPERLFQVGLRLPGGDPDEFRSIRSDPRRLVGTKVGSYKLMEFIGFGGYGVVFRAQNDRLGRNVALKIAYLNSRAHPELETLLERGARIQASLDHPNIVRILDFGQVEVLGEPRFALASEYVDGETLESWRARLRLPRDMRRLIKVFLDVCAALEGAHQTKYQDPSGFEVRGIVHGDIKPRNILVTRDGKARVIDFMMIDVQRWISMVLGDRSFPSIPRASSRSSDPVTMVYGTKGYMPPEQEEEGVVGPESDVFALGRTIEESLRGERSPRETAGAVGRAGLPVWVPRSLDRVLERATSLDRKVRYPTIQTLAADLRRACSPWRVWLGTKLQLNP